MASGRLTIIAAALGLVLLAGCASPAASEPEASAPSAVVETPAADPAPTSRVPLLCTDLADGAELRSATGAELSAVDPFGDETKTLVLFAGQQYGALDCVWSTEPLAIDLAVPVVTMTVVPEVASDRWAEFVPLMDGEGIVRGEYGTDSYVVCSPSRFDGSGCELNSLIGDYWLSVVVSAPDASVALDSAAAVFETATAAVTAMPEPSATRWVSPAADTSALDPATVSAALADPPFEVVQDTLTPQRGAQWPSMAESAMTSVVYTADGLGDGTAADFTLQVLPSGAWAFGTLNEVAGDAAGVDGLGDQAVAYPSPDGTAVVFTLGDDLVLLDVYSQGTGDETDRAIATAKSVAAALG